LEIYLPVIANWVPDEDWELSGEEVLPQKLVSLSGLLDCDLEEARLSDPAELLTRYDVLVPLLEIDGVARMLGEKGYRDREIDQ
jgi:hypothetical protein